MAVTSDDLLAPVGELHLALFPTRDALGVATQLTAYLTQGYARATAAGFTDPTRQDDIASAYAYWRAWDEALQRIIANPTSSMFNDKGSSSYSSKQLDMLQGRVDHWLGKFNSLLTPDTVAPQATGNPGGPTPAIFTW